jgi:2-pyrone-4,6-dicarboxylate lactonase
MPNTASFAPVAPTIPGPIADTRKPRVKFPPGACDCHAHVFGPQRQYPFAPGGGYVPPECSTDDYVRMLRAIGCERAVIVHPSVYGTDNRATIDALRSGKFEFRGVAVIDEPNTSDSQLEDMHQAGVRGVRINLKSKGGVVGIDTAPRLAERIKARGWHIQFFLDTNAMPDIDQKMMKLPVDIVIDHLGHIETAHGLEQPGFRTLARLTRHERCWFKLIGPYRISTQAPRFADVTPFVRALVDAAPDRCVWGTDWPHPNVKYMPNDGDLADMLAGWVPDEALRNRILAANPARLYDFK